MTTDIDVLNSVTKTLIDSHKGYERCCEVVDDSYALRSNFQERAQKRLTLVKDFQDQVRKLGGEPEEDGSVAGKVHRAWTSFSTLFANDEKAAVEAIDDGEEFLAEKIEKVLSDHELLPGTRVLLHRAQADATDGENFADALEKAL